MPTKVFYLVDDDPDEKWFFEEALSELAADTTLIWRSNSTEAMAELNDGLLHCAGRHTRTVRR